MGGHGGRSKHSGFMGGGGAGGSSSGGGIGGGSAGGGSGGGGGGGGGAGSGGGGAGNSAGNGATGANGANGTGPAASGNGAGGSLGWISTINIAGVSVEQYSMMHQFSNGTSTGGFERKARVYVLPNGQKFFYQENCDKTKQLTDIEQVVKVYQTMPEWVRNRMPNTVELVDYQNPQDQHWKQVYSNFTMSDATGGKDKITFYGTGFARSDYGVKNTMAHETGHAIDYSASSKISDSARWGEAMRLDKIASGLDSPTEYGKNAKVEDFAESLAAYVNKQTWFKTNFPNRHAVIEDIKNGIIT